LVKEEQSRNANSTDDSWMARSENIDSILEEIENQSVDNASDQQFDQTPAVAEPLAVIQEPVKEAVKAIPPPAKPTENKPAVQKQAEVTVAVVEEKAEEKVEEKAEERVEKKIGQSNDKPVVKVIKQTAVVVKPKPKPKPEPVPKAAASPADKHQGMSVAKPTYHKVTAGENLFGLSTKYNVVTDALILMNPGIEAGLKADSKVIVAGIVKHKVARGDTLTGIANHYKTTIEQLKQFNPGIDKKLMAGAKVTIKKVIISDKKAKPDSAQGLTDAFKRLAADQVLTVGNLKTFFSEWKKSNTAAKRQLLDFAEFAGLNERLQKEVSDMKQGLKVRNSTEERWIRKVAKKFAYVK
jgi:LysM repeat protein